MTILEEIAEYTKARIEKEKKQISTNELRTLAEKMNENEAKELIIMGFVSDFKKELPVEYAIELNRLLKTV